MRQSFRSYALAAAAALLLASCGGGGGGDDVPHFARVVSFGDSLSDVGSYATPGLVAATGGGKFTVNGPDAKIWVERIAAAVGAPAPCAAETGLQSSGRFASFAAPVEDHAGCFAYGQGGARVTDPIGPWNAALPPAQGGELGQLTVPVKTQIERHLQAGGGFAADDLVLVMAGGNDLFMNIAAFQAAVGGGTPQDQAAAAAVTAMGTAGAELAGYVKNLVVGGGARHVVVLNLPAAQLSPDAVAQGPQAQALIAQMVQTFNEQLAGGLAGTQANVLQVDAYALLQEQVANPAAFGIADIATPSCDPALAPEALLCSQQTLVAAATPRWYFADGNHPTPWGYELLAQRVERDMLARGWL